MCQESCKTPSKRFIINLLLFFSMGLGLATGWADLSFFNSVADKTSDLFLRLLKLISLPIIFLAVTSTITGMKDFHEMRKMGRKVFAYTLATTLIAATIALVLYILVNPARTSPVEAVNTSGAVEGIIDKKSYLSFLLNIVPSNLFLAFAESNVMGIVLISIILSMAILALPSEQKVFLNKLFSGLFAAMIKITGYVITLMPIAIWAFMTLLVKDLRHNYAHMNSLLLFLSCIVGANLLQGLIVLPLLLKIKKISPLKTFRAMVHPLTVAFFSKSSNATLPIAIQCAEKNLGVSGKIAQFTLPLCSVINMNGCAAFILTTVLFVAGINGVFFSPVELIGWIFLASFAAIGNAGVPMGCFFLTSAFLIGMDLPLYMMGLILPFYTILDMIETTLNVWSDICITTTVDKELAPVAINLKSSKDISPTREPLS